MKALQLAYGERLTITLEMIAAAAAENRECPSNAAIACSIGYLETDCVSRCISVLRDRGDLKVIRAGRYRVIEITSTGQRTFDPFDVVREMAHRAADIFDTTVKDILSDSRFREHVQARWAVMVTAFELGHGYAPIGRSIGRDHCTVMYGIDQAYHLMNRSMAFRNRVTRLQSHFLPQQAVAA